MVLVAKLPDLTRKLLDYPPFKINFSWLVYSDCTTGNVSISIVMATGQAIVEPEKETNRVDSVRVLPAVTAPSVDGRAPLSCVLPKAV